MIGLFKQKSSGNIVVVFIFGLLLKMPLFLYPKITTATSNDGRLYQLLLSSLPVNALLYSVLAFLLLYAQALMINYLVNEYRLITRQSFLPAMAYLIITSLLPEWTYLSSPLIANTFIIWTFITLFKLYNASNAKAPVYNIGLITGINSYIYFPSASFIVCILLGLMILKPFKFNEIILFLLGCTTPYYFYAAWLFITGNLSFDNFFPHISVKTPVIKSSIELAASTLLLAIPFLIGGYFIQTHLRKMLIQVRKNWSLILLYLLITFFAPFVNSDQSFYTWILITVPFTAFHACAYFYPAKKWLPQLLFFVTVGYILFQQYGTVVWK